LPSNFDHKLKVTKDVDGNFVGLPSQWIATLEQKVQEDTEMGLSDAEEVKIMWFNFLKSTVITV